MPLGNMFYTLERCEKDQNCKLQFPQPDYWPRHSPDFRTVFGIMIGPFSSCKIGKTWGTNKQVNKQTNKEIAIANSTASFFLPVSNIDLKLLLVPPAQQRLNISYWGAKKPLNNGTVLLCSSWTFISEHVMSALCSVIVLQHFFLPDFPSRGAEEPAEGDAVERGRFIGKASSQSNKALSI